MYKEPLFAGKPVAKRLEKNPSFSAQNTGIKAGDYDILNSQGARLESQNESELMLKDKGNSGS